MGPLSGVPENLTVSSATLTTTDFYRQKLWGLTFPVLQPWALPSGLGWGSLTPKVSLLTLIKHMWIRAHSVTTTASPSHITSPCHSTPPTPRLHPSYLPIRMNVASLNPWLSRLPQSSIFWQFWVLFVLRFSCNSFRGCTMRQSVSTYASILTGSPP